MSLNKAKVTILNESFSLLTDESEESVQKAAQRVDDLVKEICASGINDMRKALILAALQCATDVIALENEKNELDAAHKVLASLVDKAIAFLPSEALVR